MNTSRRSFVKQASLGIAAAGLVAKQSTVFAAANEQVGLGFIGAGGRAGELASAFAKCKNAKIISFADPDQERAAKLAANFGATSQADFRKLLEDPSIDAVVIATCNHWHVLAALWSLEAGKHVYVEKPLAHSQWEGQQLVKAATRSGKVVQIGTQQRSDPMQSEAKKFLHEEKVLGAIRYAQANRLGMRASIGKRAQPLTPPKNVDYNLWLGPAEDRPIYRDNFHYDWHWDWNTGNGEMGNWGVHVLDDVRNVAYQDSVSTPKRIVAVGGRVAWNDAGETPNVHFAWFETDSFPTIIALSNLGSTPDAKKGWSCPVDGKIEGPGSGYVIACEGGYYLGQRGRGKAVDLDGKTIREFKGGNIMGIHTQNFVDAVLANVPASLNGGLLQGHFSTGWCNLANVAVRAGKSFDLAYVQSASSHEAWQRALEQMQSSLKPFSNAADSLIAGPVLEFDQASEVFVGEHAAQGNSYLQRTYRPGFEVTAQA